MGPWSLAAVVTTPQFVPYSYRAVGGEWVPITEHHLVGGEWVIPTVLAASGSWS